MKTLTSILFIGLTAFYCPASLADSVDCSNPFGLSGAAAGAYEAGNYTESLRLSYLLLNCQPSVANIDLGRHFENGKGVNKDYHRAVVHYEKAARSGHPYAALLLARMYADGKGVLQNDVTAHVLANLAALDGVGSDVSIDGSALVRELTNRMTAKQIESAQKLAKSCKEKNKNFTYENCGF